jgi:hypothetical protein
MENYGRVNTHGVDGGIVYGEYMKTHNINPHTMGNHPEDYETYKGALNHAKRYIKDKNIREKELQL